MTDQDRARNLAALFTHCGERWREVVPIDLDVRIVGGKNRPRGVEIVGASGVLLSRTGDGPWEVKA